MRKNNNIFYIISVATLLVISVGISYLVDRSKEINPMANISGNTTPYYTEAGLENVSLKIKDAVESYLNQDITESNDKRINRLSLYFSAKSPVYSYGTKNLDSLVNKTTAKVISISSSEAEGEYPSYLVSVTINAYLKTKNEVNTQTYWVSLIKTSDGSQIPYDIGGA